MANEGSSRNGLATGCAATADSGFQAGRPSLYEPKETPKTQGDERADPEPGKQKDKIHTPVFEHDARNVMAGEKKLDCAGQTG